MVRITRQTAYLLFVMKPTHPLHYEIQVKVGETLVFFKFELMVIGFIHLVQIPR